MGLYPNLIYSCWLIAGICRPTFLGTIWALKSSGRIFRRVGPNFHHKWIFGALLCYIIIAHTKTFASVLSRHQLVGMNMGKKWKKRCGTYKYIYNSFVCQWLDKILIEIKKSVCIHLLKNLKMFAYQHLQRLFFGHPNTELDYLHYGLNPWLHHIFRYICWY